MANGPAPEEKRQAPRVARGFMVRYRSAKTGGAWAVSPMKDLSRGGARFSADLALEPGDTLDLQLMLPVSRDPVAVKATVAWARAGVFGTTEVGVAFDVGDEAILKTLVAAAAQFAHKKP